MSHLRNTLTGAVNITLPGSQRCTRSQHQTADSWPGSSGGWRRSPPSCTGRTAWAGGPAAGHLDLWLCAGTCGTISNQCYDRNKSLRACHQLFLFIKSKSNLKGGTQPTSVLSNFPRRWWFHHSRGSGPRRAAPPWRSCPRTRTRPGQSPAGGCTAGWRDPRSRPADASRVSIRREDVGGCVTDRKACASSVNHPTLSGVLNQTQLNSLIKRRLRLSHFFSLVQSLLSALNCAAAACWHRLQASHNDRCSPQVLIWTAALEAAGDWWD